MTEDAYAALQNGPLAVAEDLLAAFLVKYPGDGVAGYHRQLSGDNKVSGCLD